MSEIKDEIRNGRIINKEVVTAAAEELAKKRNAKLTKEGDFMKATKVDKDLCIGCGLCCGSATRFSV